jgi:hypothetical protein
MTVHVALDLSQSTDYELRKLHEEIQAELAKRRPYDVTPQEEKVDEFPYTVEFVNEESRQCRYAAKTGLETIVDAVNWINYAGKPFGGYYRIVRESNR